MMSHDNLTFTARCADVYLRVVEDDSFISYLPLSHSAAQVIKDNYKINGSNNFIYFIR